VTTKRLRRRAHRSDPKAAERLSLVPLTFEQALKGALATKPPKDDQEEGAQDADAKP